MSREKELLTLLGHLYDATTDSDKWAVFLKELAIFFNAFGGHVAYFDHQNQAIAFSVLHGFDHMKPDWFEIGQDVWETDPRLVYMERYPSKPFSCRLMLDEEEFRNSRAYKELLRYSLAEYTLAVSYKDENDVTATLSIHRFPEGTHFTQEECDLLGHIVPHFKRAVELHKRLAVLDFDKQTAFMALESMPLGIMICEYDGRVKYQNKAVRDILVQGAGLQIINERVHCGKSSETSALQNSISEAVDSAVKGTPFPGHAMTVSRNMALADLHLGIRALWKNNIKLGLGFLAHPLAVVYVSDPTKPQESDVGYLQRLFGLSLQESRLTNFLVKGKSLREASSLMNISYETARSYIKTIFSKTGTSRQSDLIRLILQSPSWNEMSHYEALPPSKLQ